MPLIPSDRTSLKQLYANLADAALQPDSPFYEPMYQRLGLDDPVQQISTLIDFDGVESIRLFSGFRGSGKTRIAPLAAFAGRARLLRPLP